ncbi:MAG: ABC transporter ATP-binding protein [Chloroflexota bacterium]
MTTAITLEDITFTYAGADQPALKRLSFDVPIGQICAVIGHSGAGKSTLCALCTGFIPNFYQGHITGLIHINGEDAITNDVATLIRHVGLVSSDPHSQISGACFTVYEELGFGLENIGLPRDKIEQRIEWALQHFRLDAQRDQSPYDLSGGQLQRLILAAIVVMQPPVLVLDEPTAHLDPFAAQDLAQILRDLSSRGTTILLTEPRLAWAATVAERIITLEQGSIVTDEENETLRVAPKTPQNSPFHTNRSSLLPFLEGQTQVWVETLKVADQTAPIVQLDGVHFAYSDQTEVLRDISFQIRPGERVALLGENGVGKSTLVQHLNGLLLPTRGFVYVAGTRTTDTTVAQCARHVGIVFQDTRNQLFARTVRDELLFGPRNLGYNPADTKILIDEALEILGLTEVAAAHPYDLSLPQRRFVAIAAVLTLNSQLLVLDEPTAGMDDAGLQRLKILIEKLTTQGKSVLVVSHDPAFCLEIADRVMVLDPKGLAFYTNPKSNTPRP